MIVVERATPEDLPDIHTIDRLVTGDERRRELLTKATLDRLMLVARRGFTRLGYGIVNRAFFDQVFVAYIAVHPDHRRRGVASALLAYAEKTCPQPKLFTVTPETDTIAQTMLAKRGYIQSGSVQHIYLNEAALIYVRLLT